MKIYRQGDVLIKQINKLPKGLKKVKDKTLAYGEVTDHSHRFKDATPIELFLLNDAKYLQVNLPSPLIHEEHKKIIIEPGKYEITQEREYDYFENELRQVVD